MLHFCSASVYVCWNFIIPCFPCVTYLLPICSAHHPQMIHCTVTELIDCIYVIGVAFLCILIHSLALIQGSRAYFALVHQCRTLTCISYMKFPAYCWHLPTASAIVNSDAGRFLCCFMACAPQNAVCCLCSVCPRCRALLTLHTNTAPTQRALYIKPYPCLPVPAPQPDRR